MAKMKERNVASMGVKGLIGMGFGVVCGIILVQLGGTEVPWILQATKVFDMIGQIFLRMLRMIIVPLVFCCITNAIIGLKELRMLRKLGTKTFAYFFITSCIFATLGIVVAQVIQPGNAFTLEQFQNAAYDGEAINFMNTVVNFFPSNIIQSMANTELLQIIVFCVFLGISILALGEKAQVLATFLKNLEDAIFKIIAYVMLLLPLGAFCLVANSITIYGPRVMGGLFQFIACDWIASLIGIFTVHLLLAVFVCKMNFLKFLYEFKEAIVVAMSTCSSTTTLPVSTKTAKEKIGVSPAIADFVIPLGSTANMNGSSVFFALITVFTCQLMGITLTPLQYVMLVIQSCLLAISCSTVPNTGVVIAVTILTSFGLPLDAIGLIVGVYRFCDMIHTPTNCIGDWVCAASIASSEGALDREICVCSLKSAES